MHEKNSSSRHVTKMGGGVDDYAEGGGGANTLSVTCPQGAKYAGGGGRYAVTPARRREAPGSSAGVVSTLRQSRL